MQSSLGQRLLLLRDRADLTLRQLARKANVSEGIVQAIEQGRRNNATLLTLFRLADALGVTIAELLRGIGSEYLRL
jgi:transcriptional regulator with XRE-family HTH domain